MVSGEIIDGDSMISISLCMIVKNEEQTIGRCLTCAKKFADEIIIVDTGSTDATKEIAMNFNVKIYDFEWVDDFSKARNYSFSKATKDYIMWLDADDVILEEDIKKIVYLKKAMDPNVDVAMMRYNLGTNTAENINCSFFRERLLKRTKKFTWHDPVHEYLILSGKIINTDICITHKKIHPRSDRNLKIFEKMLSQGKELSSRNYFYYGRELFANQRYDEAIENYQKFLDTEGGLASNYMDACIDLARIFAMKNDKKAEKSALLRSFEHDTPHAEICCQLGYYYKNAKAYDAAISWFDLATRLQKPEYSWGSVIPECWDYIPFMELCSCYFKLNNLDEAIRNNKKALERRPTAPTALHNMEFLQSLVNPGEKEKVCAENSISGEISDIAPMQADTTISIYSTIKLAKGE